MKYIVFSCTNCYAEVKAKIIGMFFGGVVIEPTQCPSKCGMTFHAVEIEEES